MDASFASANKTTSREKLCLLYIFILIICVSFFEFPLSLVMHISIESPFFFYKSLFCQNCVAFYVTMFDFFVTLYVSFLSFSFFIVNVSSVLLFFSSVNSFVQLFYLQSVSFPFEAVCLLDFFFLYFIFLDFLSRNFPLLALFSLSLSVFIYFSCEYVSVFFISILHKSSFLALYPYPAIVVGSPLGGLAQLVMGANEHISSALSGQAETCVTFQSVGLTSSLSA